MSRAIRVVLDWFAARGWTPFDYQQQVWRAYLEGESGLVHAPTGVGKTLAAWLGPLIEHLHEEPSAGPCSVRERRPGARRSASAPLRVLWITPLRALAHDTLLSLRAPTADLGLPWSVEMRTGDTSTSIKARQKERLPTALVTTPESLSLMLSYPDSQERFSSLRCVVVDEWHELMSTKRGVQTELALARLRHWRPRLRTWGLSATLGNLQQARDVLMGTAPADDRRPARLITADRLKDVRVETLIPDDVAAYPWSGHLGTRLVEGVAGSIAEARSALLFTNTRSQAELWFQALLLARPDWLGRIALHHGSLERELRRKVEQMLGAGHLRCVVCTSSLDLGVDFSPVDRVFQVGSPKGISRLLQRAGRSGHQPGATSTIVCVPTHAFELVEFAAARKALSRRDVEARPPIEKPLDVLVQHLVTIACGGGFVADGLRDEVRSTYAYRELSETEWGWCLDFCVRGGATLNAYPQYARITRDEGGRFVPSSPQAARLHRLNIGTITSDPAIAVCTTRGRRLGTIEESFLSRLRPGDHFVFAGRTLELVGLRGGKAVARPVRRGKGIVPRWNGARFPLSTQLGASVRHELAIALQEPAESAEIRAALPLLTMQARQSILPGPDELLFESTRTREGWHWFVFPFEGRLVHEGLAVLVAQRVAQRGPCTIHVTCNDYGFELLTTEPLDLSEDDWRRLLDADHLTEALLACLNSTQMARRPFRDIARIAGLVFQGYPGAERPARQLQASSDLFFDVFRDFDAGSLLLEQAQREVLDQQLEIRRLHAALERQRSARWMLQRTAQLSPLAFPLWAESLRAQSISSESWAQRVKKMAMQLENAAPPSRAGARRVAD